MIYLPDFVQNPSVKPRRQLKVEDAPPAQLADSSPTSATPATALLPKDLAAIHDHAHILYHFVSPRLNRPDNEWTQKNPKSQDLNGLQLDGFVMFLIVSYCVLLFHTLCRTLNSAR